LTNTFYKSQGEKNTLVKFDFGLEEELSIKMGQIVLDLGTTEFL